MNSGQRTAAVAVLILGVALASAQVAPSPTPTAPPQRVVAWVESVPITEQEVAAQVAQLYPSDSLHGGLPEEKQRDLRRRALEELVMQELVWKNAQKTGTVASMAETQREYARVRARYGARAFDGSLREHRITTQEYLRKLQRHLTIRSEVARHVNAPSVVSETAVRLYYNGNRDRFVRPERVRARMILIRIGGPGAQAERDARQMADSLHEQLTSGKDFAGLAARYSDDMSRARGGDIGWIHRGSADPELENAVFRLPAGQFSAPVRIQPGFALVKAEAREARRQLTYAEVRGGLKAQLEQKRQEEARRAWIAGLKKGARIQVLTGPAASGNHSTKQGAN